MIRSIGTLIGWLAVTMIALAQPAVKETAVDTMYLRTLAETRSFQLGRPVRPLPTPDGKFVLFLRSGPRASKLSLFEFDVETGKTRELLTPADLLKGAEEKLSPEEKAARERMRVSVGGFTNFQLNEDGSLILLSLSGKLYTVERATKKVSELPTGKGFLLDPKFSPDGKKVSYVRDHDVYVLDVASKKETRVTTGGTALVEHGVAEFVAQEEMGRFTGYWWSPDSDKIAYQETDNSDVEVWHVADPMHPDAKPTPFFYPRPGKNNAKVKLGVVSITAGPSTRSEASGSDLVVTPAGRTQRSSNKLDVGLGERIKTIPGVHHVEGAFFDLESYPEAPIVYNFGLDPSGRLIADRWFKDGRMLTPDDGKKVILGSVLARKLNKKIGGTFEINGEAFQVVGIYYSYNLLENNGAIAPLKEMQKVFAVPGKVSTFSILLQDSHRSPDKVEAIQKQIEALRTPAGKIYDIDVQITRDPAKASQEVQASKGKDENASKTTWIEWDRKKYPYLATVRWSKKAPLCLTVQSRDQRELVLLDADLKTGKTTTLLSEKSSTWVNLRQEVPRWLPSGDSFLWVSEKDDIPRLELRNRDGKMRRVTVHSEVGYQSLVSVDKSGDEIIFNASMNPTESQLYRYSLKEPFAEAEPITKTPGMHSAVFSRDHSLYVLTSRTMDAMPKSLVYRKDGKLIGELPSVAENPARRPVVDLVQVGIKERRFHAAVVFPRDYDAKKKYPVIVDVYGGPHHLHVMATQNRWLLDQWYADQGFMVVAIDGRGTPGRGAEWERAIYQKFGSVPLDDQVTGLKKLAAKYPMMDLTRVGIDGWSFGGYMSALAVMRRPDVFRAGVAGAPVCDWHDYDTHYTERYLGVPPKDAAAYKEGSLLTYAKDLKRPLMILHGTADDNVYFRHSLKMVDALFREGKDFEMVPLSGLTHMVPDPLVMERLHGRIAAFFQKHLGRPE